MKYLIFKKLPHPFLNKMFIYFFAVVIFLLYCSRIRIHEELLTPTSFPNWPQYGGNIHRTNYYPHPITLPVELIWENKVSSAVEKTMIIVDGILYLGTLDGKIHAIQLETGMNISDKKFDYAATCCYYDNHLIIAKRYGNDTLFNLDLLKGKFKWHIDAGDISSEPLITANSLIVTALYKHIDLYTIDSEVKIWTFETDDQIRSSPAMANNKVIFGCDNGYVYALNASSGNLLWKFKTQKSVQATPTIDPENNIVYIGSIDYYFYAIDIENGQEIWKFKTGGQILQAAALSQQKIIFGSSDRKVYCLDRKTGNLLWSVAAKSVISTNPLITDNIIFWGSLDHFLYAADINNGNLLWQYKTKGRIQTSPVIWGNYLIIASEDNYIYAFKSKE